MLINNVNKTYTPSSYYRNPSSNAGLFLKPQLTCDVVSFGQGDLLLLPKNEIINLVKSSIDKPENLLGRGGEAEVYRIEGSDYCVRVPRFVEKKDINRLSKRLSAQDRINHIVAKLGNGVSIMPIIKGADIKHTPNAENVISNMPQKAFNDLLMQICEAYNHNMEFDVCWNNVIINPKDKTMTAIDFYKPTEGLRGRILNSLYSVFTEYTGKDKTFLKTCAGRVLLSVAQVLQPGQNPPMLLSGLGLTRLTQQLKEEDLFENPKYYDVLNNCLKHIEDLKNAELRKEDVFARLNGQIKILKALVKQLFNVI